MSSRNTLLSEEERQKASIIYKGLREAKIAARDGERNAAILAEIVRKTIETEPLAAVDYVAVVDNETLEPVEKVGESAVLIAVAARFGRVRLIDNTVLNRKQ
jgi:pantoate--beta-alanine ligase